MADILKLFGKRVREIRKAQGLSQEELAERANLHNTYIGGVERGERNLSLKSIEKIADALKISANIFLEKNRRFVVSEESEGESYISRKNNALSPLDQEMLKLLSSLNNNELRNCIITILKIVLKPR